MSKVNYNNSNKNCSFAENGTQSTILKTIRDHTPISRSAIADYTGIPRAATTRNVARLMNRNILIEHPLADTRISRRRNGLSLNPQIGYCLSISYDSKGINGCIMDAAYKTLFEDSIYCDMEYFSKKEKINNIILFIEKLCIQMKGLPGKCLGLAVVDPGVIDKNHGIIVDCSVMDHWQNIPIVKILEEQFNIPVILFSGSLAYIRAVDFLELQGAIEDILYIQYGDGIGCCIKLGGHYISGHSGRAGEFGHWHLNNQKKPCRCGRTGCLEAIVAMPALKENAQKAIGNGESSLLSKKADFQGHDVLLAARNGDRLACSIVHEAFACLGEAVGGLINTLAPKVVLFENTIGDAGDHAISALFQSVMQNVLPANCKSLSLQVSTLKSHLYNISALGGATAFLDCMLEKE